MMQLRISVLYVSFCAFISFCGYAQQYQFAVEHITKADGLSNTEITSIVQDKQGFIWIGTRYGLNKFDGYSVKVYQTVPGNTSSLCDNNITTLFADSRGDLWVGTENNGVSVYNRSLDKFINYEFDEYDINSLSANYVTSIKEDSKGNIWIGTAMGLNRFRPQTKDFVRFLRIVDVEVDDSTVGKVKALKFSSQLVQYLQKSLWIKKEYYAMAKDIATMVPKPAIELVMKKILQSCRVENRGAYIKAMEIDERDNIWFGFEKDSIGKFNPEKIALTVFPILHKGKSQHIQVLSLCWEKGKLWIGTRDWGLMRFDASSKTFENFEITPYAKLVKCIMRDSRGTIWVGDDEGLSFYDTTSDIFHRASNVEYDDKLLSADVSAILEDAQGNFWAASYQGGINLLKRNQSFIHDKFIDEVISPSGSKSVSAVLEDSQGNLWIGYFTSGIDLFLKGSKEKISFSSLKTGGLGKGSVFAIIEDSRKNIWISTYEGGLQRYDKIRRRFISYPFKSEKNMYDVRGICEDKNGNLWIAAPGNGVGKFNIEKNLLNSTRPIICISIIRWLMIGLILSIVTEVTEFGQVV